MGKTKKSLPKNEESLMDKAGETMHSIGEAVVEGKDKLVEVTVETFTEAKKAVQKKFAKKKAVVKKVAPKKKAAVVKRLRRKLAKKLCLKRKRNNTLKYFFHRIRFNRAVVSTTAFYL